MARGNATETGRPRYDGKVGSSVAGRMRGAASQAEALLGCSGGGVGGGGSVRRSGCERQWWRRRRRRGRWRRRAARSRSSQEKKNDALKHT